MWCELRVLTILGLSCVMKNTKREEDRDYQRKRNRVGAFMCDEEQGG